MTSDNKLKILITGETVFYRFSTRVYWNLSLAASDLFPMFTQSINFYVFYCHINKEYRCL